MSKYIAIILVVLLVAALFLVTVQCSDCGGKGVLGQNSMVRTTCSKCGGSGKGKWGMNAPSSVKPVKDSAPMCLKCRGRGYAERRVLRDTPCEACGADGKQSLFEQVMCRWR